MIDLKTARELLAKAVDTQGPDFVYNPGQQYGCHYEPLAPERHSGKSDDHRNKTGCLVGVALSLHGETWHIGETRNIYGLWADNDSLMTHRAAQYFQRAQRVQDDGESWGKALAEAEEFAEEVSSEPGD